jgi:SAM-dependent methyltransferase
VKGLDLHIGQRETEMLDQESRAYMERMYAGGLERYENRLNAIGFTGMESVLDAGCGFGQWSLALATHNREVVGVDISPDRIRCAASIAREHDVHNVRYSYGTLEELPFHNQSFDGIFCYSSVHHADERKSLDEFSRLLKPGGRLYLNFNCLGWFLHLLWNKGLCGKDSYSTGRALMALRNFFLGRRSGYHVVTVSGIKRGLSRRNFTVLAMDGDGCVETDGNKNKAPSFYKPSYFGFPGVMEVLAEKKL